MADDADRRPARRRLLDPKASAQHRADADGRHWIAPDESGEHALRLVPAGDVAIPEVEREQLVQRCHAGADVVVLRRRDGLDEPPLAIHGRIGDTDGDEPVRVRVRERPEHDAVDDAVDERVGADPQGERDNHNERDTWALRYRAPGVPEVLRERTHAISLRGGTVRGTVSAGEALSMAVAAPLTCGRDALTRRAGNEVGGHGAPERRGSIGVGTVPPRRVHELLDLATVPRPESRRVESQQRADDAGAEDADAGRRRHAGSGRPSSRFARAMPTRRSMRRASATATCLPNGVMR